MRRIRKIIGNDRIMPVIKESQNRRPSIRQEVPQRKILKLNIKPENVTLVKRIDNKVIPETQNYEVSKVEPIWLGETVYIIGGGPSLSDFKWNRLNGKKTIAINKSILSYPQADIMYWTDSRVYGWYKKEIDKFKGLKYTIRHHHSYTGDIKVLKRGNKFGLEEAKDTLAHGNNSGYAAINLAYLLGAKKIILLGYDMKNDGKRGHYHDGYPAPVTGDNIYKEQFIPGFNVLADLLKAKNITVLNASPQSSLTVWPKITLDQALSLK